VKVTKFRHSRTTQAGRGTSLLAIHVIGALGAAAAYADQTRTPGTQDAQPAVDTSTVALQEITVTARRREETLQSVPVAATVLGGQDLAQQNIRDLGEIDAHSPNMAFVGDSVGQGGTADFAMPGVTIRGQSGGDGTITSETAVGLYVDGVYIPRSNANFLDILDLERIEVLRGPQGTLFGRNTTGGAINLITRNPVPRTEGSVTVTAGSHGRRNMSATFNAPLAGDALAVRASIATEELADGVAKNFTTGRDDGTEDKTMARLSLLWRPASNVEVIVKGDWMEADNRPVPLQTASGVPGGTADQMIQLATGGTQGILDFVDSDFYSTYADHDVIHETKLKGLMSQITADFGAASVRLISAKRWHETYFKSDVDGTPFVVFHTDSRIRQQQHSQELHIFGTALDGALDWLTGVYYFEESATDDTVTNSLELFNPRNPSVDHRVADNESQSAFVHFSYDLPWIDRLGFFAGARYTEDRKKYASNGPRLGEYATEADALAVAPAGTFVVQAPDGTWNICNIPPNLTDTPGVCRSSFTDKFDAWSYNVGFDYQLLESGSHNAMGYLSFARGFRSGGRNTRAAGPGFPRYEPEYVRSYEVGVKASWFDRRLQTNLAVFLQDFTNVQQTAIIIQDGRAFSVVENAAEATIRGAELEVAAIPVRDLARPGDRVRLQLTAGYTDAEYDEFTDFGGPGNTLRDRSDEPYRFTPEWTYSIGAVYETPTQKGMFSARADWMWRDRVYFATTRDMPSLIQGGYGLLNARLSLSFDDPNVEISLWGKNLTDKEYKAAALDFGALGYTLYAPGSPRMWGADIVWHFGN